MAVQRQNCLALLADVQANETERAAFYAQVRADYESGAFNGRDFRILGYFAAAAELDALTPMAGDAYGVGSNGVYNVYVWDGVNSTWVNNGQLKGEKGEKGDTGEQGPQGEKGEKGDTGPQGDKGEQGVKGDTGAGFAVLGYFDTADALAGILSPAPGAAYGIGSAAPYDIYIWDGVNSVWVNNGQLQGAKGDTGETGPQGQQGEPGPQGVPGYSPVCGTDYFTASDRAAIVADVLAALPDGDGVSY